MQNTNRTRRREPMSDTQLLLTITICIFFGLYILAMLVWGGGFLRPQQCLTCSTTTPRSSSSPAL